MSDSSLLSSLDAQREVLEKFIMLSSTAVVLDKAAELDQKCLDAAKSVSLDETDCVMISRAELLQSSQKLHTST